MSIYPFWLSIAKQLSKLSNVDGVSVYLKQHTNVLQKHSTKKMICSKCTDRICAFEVFHSNPSG